MRSTFSRGALLDRLEAAELQARELDTAGGAHRDEAEVGEEVAREDGSVDEEALGRRRALAIPVGERLERPGALVSRLADRSEEEGLLDPRLRVGDEIRAGDEDGIIGGRPGGQVGGARE